MPLYTQLSTLKTRLGITDTADDTLLTNLIKHVSGRFNQECSRHLDRVANTTEEFNAGQAEFLVSRYPVETVTQFDLKASESEGWVAQTDVAYLLRSSCLISLPAPLGSTAEQVRVTYTGGYVLPGTTPGAGQTALPDELEQACIEQAAFWHQNRNRLGLRSVPAEGRTFFQLAELDLLPQVREVLKHYRRILA